MNTLDLEIGGKQGYFSWLANRTVPQKIVLESCSNP